MEGKMKVKKGLNGFFTGMLVVIMGMTTTVFSEGKTDEKIFKGQVTFQYYCTTCHGVSGMGDGPAAKEIYKNLKIAPRNLSNETFQNSRTDNQLFKVISGGMHSDTTKAAGMPAWGKTFSKEEIRQLIGYIRTLKKAKKPANPKAVEKGKSIFITHCSLCHGLSGKGDGPYIVSQRKKDPKHPKPPDFTDANFVQTLSETEISDTIYKGGGHAGKSDVMPSWWKSLSKQDIKNLTAYIKSFAK